MHLSRLNTTICIFVVLAILSISVSCKKQETEDKAESTTEVSKDQSAEEEIDPIKEYGIYKSIFEHGLIELLDVPLTESDINDYPLHKLMLVRNAYAARKGYTFKSRYYDAIFRSQSWYNPKDEIDLEYSNIEQKNIELIKTVEEQKSSDAKIDPVNLANSCLVHIYNKSQKEQEADNYFEKQLLLNADTSTLYISNYGGDFTHLWTALVYGFLDYYKIRLSEKEKMNNSNLSNVWHYAQHRDKDTKTINSLFEEIYGQPLIIEKEKIKNAQSFSGSIVHYNPGILTDMYNTIYKQPESTIAGIKYSVIYNGLFKEYIRIQAEYILPFLRNIPEFEELYDEYISMVFTAYNSQLHDFWEKGEKKFDYPDWEGSDYLGFLLRRHHDKTLPTILELFMKTIKVYDPEYYSYIQSNYGNSLQTYLRYYKNK